jgi:hypothetical protein
MTGATVDPPKTLTTPKKPFVGGSFTTRAFRRGTSDTREARALELSVIVGTATS